MIGPRIKNRHERRQHRREIKDLSDRASKLHEELLSNEALVQSIDAQIAELTPDTLRLIEEYVDSQAKVFDIDDHRVATDLEDPRLSDLLVACHWRGVQTVEQAKEELLQEVARRSVGKTDVGLLLTSIDHTAFVLWARLPESLKLLHGEALVEASVERLVSEGFDSTLMRDPNWDAMRDRWIRLGWRGADDDTFNQAFIRAVAERVAYAGLVLDTVIDEKLKKARPEAREKMIAAFQERLDREYEALASSRIDSAVRVNRAVDALSKLPPDEARSLILNEMATRPEVSPGMVVGEDVDPADFTSDGDWWNDSIPYSDHELMRRGRSLWEASYAQSMTDEDVRTNVVRSDAGFPAELVHFSAKWAVHAFQRLMTSHTFAAALMCSDVQRDVLVGIEKQWDAFLVIVPNGMLIADRFEFTRVMIAVYDFGARMLLVTSDPMSRHRRSPVGLVDEAPTLADLLVSEETDLVAESQAARCFVMAKRLVAGLLLNLQHEAGNFQVKRVEARPKSKKREAEPEHRIVTIGKPLEIDCRASVKEYIERGKVGRKHGAPTVQVMVRGHYTHQPYGPRSSLRKVIWKQPFWRGPEAALIQTRPKVGGGSK
jgi:hypothetical protein